MRIRSTEQFRKFEFIIIVFETIGSGSTIAEVGNLAAKCDYRICGNCSPFSFTLLTSHNMYSCSLKSLFCVSRTHDTRPYNGKTEFRDSRTGIMIIIIII